MNDHSNARCAANRCVIRARRAIALRAIARCTPVRTTLGAPLSRRARNPSRAAAPCRGVAARDFHPRAPQRLEAFEDADKKARLDHPRLWGPPETTFLRLAVGLLGSLHRGEALSADRPLDPGTPACQTRPWTRMTDRERTSSSRIELDAIRTVWRRSQASPRSSLGW